MEVLVVCTGNICRSPMAEGLLRDRLARHGIEASVRSAGLVTHDRPASEHGVDAMHRRGIDITAHRSQRLATNLVERADLVLGMERQHVREAVVLVPDAFDRTFTLPALARAARSIGPRKADESVSEWLGRASAGRRPADLLGTDPADEIEDPIGRGARHYERTAAEIEGLVDVVCDHLFPHGAGAPAER